MIEKFTLTVNGTKRSVETIGNRPLLDVLREDLGLTGTKYGCGEGQCRACTVLLDGRATPSCLTPLNTLGDRSVQTSEGLVEGDELGVVQQAFVDAEAMQCGYCVPGMILTTKALLARNASPSEDEIVEGMNANLCRCCGYKNLIEAVKLAAGRMVNNA